MTTRHASHNTADTPPGSSPATVPAAPTPLVAPVVAPAPVPAPASAPASASGPTVTLAEMTAKVKATRIQIHETLAMIVALMGETSPGSAGHRPRPNKQRLQAVPELVEMLRLDPTLAAKVSPDDMESAMTTGQALDFLASDFTTGRGTVKLAAAMQYNRAWTGGSMVYTTAEEFAKSTGTVDDRLTKVQTLLAKGPRSKTAPKVVAKAQAEANTAVTRARQAQAKVVRKTRSQERAAQAHADAHPDVTIIPATDPTTPTGNNNGHG